MMPLQRAVLISPAPILNRQQEAICTISGPGVAVVVKGRPYPCRILLPVAVDDAIVMYVDAH